MALKTRVWSAGKILMLVAGLAATFILFFAVSMRLALKAGEAEVPDLTNHTANEATAILTNLGLTLKVDDSRRPDPKIGAGRVLGQEPPGGSIARRQRSVKVWLSAGQRAATVPLLAGESERAAHERTEQVPPCPALGEGPIADICGKRHRRVNESAQHAGEDGDEYESPLERQVA